MELSTLTADMRAEIVREAIELLHGQLIPEHDAMRLAWQPQGAEYHFSVDNIGTVYWLLREFTTPRFDDLDMLALTEDVFDGVDWDDEHAFDTASQHLMYYYARALESQGDWVYISRAHPFSSLPVEDRAEILHDAISLAFESVMPDEGESRSLVGWREVGSDVLYRLDGIDDLVNVLDRFLGKGFDDLDVLAAREGIDLASTDALDVARIAASRWVGALGELGEWVYATCS